MNDATPPEVPIRACPAGRGVDWVGEGFELFRKAPGTWIGLLLVWLVLSGALAAVGAQAINSFLNPVFQAGILMGCAGLVRGEALKVEHLFAGFRSGRIGPLLLMSLLLIAAAVVLGLIMVAAFLGLANAPGLSGLGPDLDVEALLSNESALTLLLAALVCVALALPLAMMAWFAPALIVFRDQSAWQAMKLSLRACLKNWLAFLLYGLVVLVMMLVALIPLGLGLLVAVPVAMASVYTSYRDIFPEKLGSEQD